MPELNRFKDYYWCTHSTLERMAISNASRELVQLAAGREIMQHHSELRYQVLPLSMLILALVVTAGMAFFRSDYWLLGASFIAGGFLVVSTLLYLASKRVQVKPVSSKKVANTKHLGAGTLSTAVGAVALLAVMGEIGAQLGIYKVFVAQIGFALVIMGGFWLVLTLRDMV